MWKRLLGKRCIISASSFFEWEKINGKTGAKFEISVQGEPIFGFAALYDKVPNQKTGEMDWTFLNITTTPSTKFADLHDRQPVILDRSEYEEWLRAKEPTLHLLGVFPEEKMLITKVADVPQPRPKKKRNEPQEPPMPGLFD
jgi:putative SOS response-associated peptidase YedK